MTQQQVDVEDLNTTLREIAVEYTEALREQWGESVVAVVLFGSVARGEATERSDIDLLIVLSGLPEGRLARHTFLEPIDERMEPRFRALHRAGVTTDVSPVFKTPAEAQKRTPLYLDLVEDAEILYERDAFFSTVLEGMRRSLERLGARRLQRGRVRYWDLKPDSAPGEVFEI